MATAIDDELLSPQERRVLLEEIGDVALALSRDLNRAEGADAAACSPIAPPDAATSPLERLNLLLAIWPQVEAAVARLVACPEGLLRTEPRPVPLPRARGGWSAGQALARAHGAAAAWMHRDLPRSTASPEALLADRRAVLNYDTPDNRLAGALLRDLEREAGDLTALSAYCGEIEAAAAAQKLQAAAAGWRRRSFFGALPSPTPRDQAWLAPNGALHHALFAKWRALQHNLCFDWSNSPLLRLPTLDPWHLYEIWCCFMTAAALKRLGWQAVDSSLLRCTPNGLRLVLATGQASRICFVHHQAMRGGRRLERCQNTLTLLYRPLFRSANQRAGNQSGSIDQSGDMSFDATYRSITHAMQPDIALERQGRLMLLDAKYRRYDERDAAPNDARIEPVLGRVYAHTDRALLDDLDKMHAYRDAIVRRNQPAVHGAWCLFPGSTQPGEDIVAYPASAPELPYGTAGIGAIRLRPGSNHSALVYLLKQWLSDER